MINSKKQINTNIEILNFKTWPKQHIFGKGLAFFPFEIFVLFVFLKNLEF